MSRHYEAAAYLIDSIRDDAKADPEGADAHVRAQLLEAVAPLAQAHALLAVADAITALTAAVTTARPTVTISEPVHIGPDPDGIPGFTAERVAELIRLVNE